jgi:recombination protein RecA
MGHKFKLTEVQRSIIVGKLLGDGHLSSQTKGKTYVLKIERSISQKAYVDWQYQNLINLVGAPPRIKLKSRYGKLSQNYKFDTLSYSSFRFFGQSFYQNGKKKIPLIIGKLLTPLALSVWFMDDGSIKSNSHRALILNTQCFREADLKRLQEALIVNFGIETVLRKQKDGKQIYILSQSVEKFIEIISPNLLPSMKYKLGRVNLKLT